jgi:oxepin-CoA hydrolase/3-oxo-5,6-dehydrosuberyl-CoA semialdehyde dehydrogenase
MNFIDWDLPEILIRLNSLTAEKIPAWGRFTPQQMVEHLTNGLSLSMGHVTLPMEVSDEKALQSKAFLYTDKPFGKDIKVGFVNSEKPLGFEELELAVDAFTEGFMAFDEYYESNPEATHSHPNFGPLNHEEWLLLHRKHISHHLEQFGL